MSTRETLLNLSNSSYIPLHTGNQPRISMPPPAVEAAYKSAKQAFVANNPGSTVLDIQAVSLVGWTSYILYAALIPPPPPTTAGKHPSPAVEYGTVFFPLLLGQTVCSNHPYWFNAGILLVSLLLRVSNIRHQRTTSTNPNHVVANASGSSAPPSSPPARPQRTQSASHSTTTTTARPSHKPFLTTWRAHMMCMTIIAILAVDFPIFPRRFGKTEDWGTSLMDVGVGSFVFSQGLVSGLAARKARRNDIPLDGRWSVLSTLGRTVRRCVPVIALGFVRVAMVKGVDYPEHVTEYGVHWNFFFTLAAMPILSALLVPVRRYIPNTLLIVFILAGQTLALHAGLEAWVLSPESGSRRGTGLVNMNKEGIVSLPGYLAIYFIGALVGEYVRRAPSSAEGKTEEVHDSNRLTPGLAVFSGVSWVVFYLSRQVLGMAVSRRMANAPYVAWTAAYNTTFLLGYHLIEQYMFMPRVEQTRKLPRLLEAVNKNGLVVFLLANLLTGLINISMQTMYAADVVAFGVLVAYTSGLSVAAWLLKGRRVAL